MNPQKKQGSQKQILPQVFGFFHATWVILIKDLQVWLRQPVTIAATFVPPLVFLLVQAIGSAAVGRSPVALVVLDSGPQGAQIAQAIRQADVFRLQEVDAARAQLLLKNIDVVAVVTIPADFSQRLQDHQGANVDVTVNNLNLDFTNDIRRAVPDAITHYYLAQGNQSPIKVTMLEHDLRPRDIALFQYSILPTVVLLLMISGLISGGFTTAREWELSTVKELLLSPAPGGAIIAGKVLASFATSFTLGSSGAAGSVCHGLDLPGRDLLAEHAPDCGTCSFVRRQFWGGDRSGTTAYFTYCRHYNQPLPLPVLPGWWIRGSGL